MFEIDFTNSDNKDFALYWSELPKNRATGMPEKSSFDPVHIPLKLLPNLILFEIIARDRIHVRLAGTGVTKIVRARNNGGETISISYRQTCATSRPEMFATLRSSRAV